MEIKIYVLFCFGNIALQIQDGIFCIEGIFISVVPWPVDGFAPDIPKVYYVGMLAEIFGKCKGTENGGYHEKI